MHRGDTGAPPRLPALDALRGIAILLVVCSHVGLPGCRWAGQSGVAVFFVLSGFLITRILVRGQAVGVFYARRAARLLPALLCVVAANALVTADHTWVWPVLGYVGNWWTVSGHPTAFLGHTWSLAVEEQFYLLWPALLGLLAPRHRMVVVAAALLAWRVLAWRVGWDEEVQWGTVSNALGLVLGSWVAVARLRVPARVGGAALCLSLLVVVACNGAGPGLGFLVCVPAVTALSVLVVASADGLPASPLLRSVGAVSYGWYLWHNSLLAAFGGEGLVQRSLLASVGLAVAVLSLHLVERPVQRLVCRALDGASAARRVRPPEGDAPAVLGCPRRPGR